MERWKSRYFSVMKYFGFIILTRSVFFFLFPTLHSIRLIQWNNVQEPYILKLKDANQFCKSNDSRFAQGKWALKKKGILYFIFLTKRSPIFRTKHGSKATAFYLKDDKIKRLMQKNKIQVINLNNINKT